MGGPKAKLVVGGKPILEWLLDRIMWRGPTMLVFAPGVEAAVGTEGFDYCVSDAVENEGPMRGILTALENLRTEMVVVTTVDMPGVSRAKLEWMVGKLAARENVLGLMCCVKADGRERVEPFPAVFRVGAREVIGQWLGERRRSVRELAKEKGFGIVQAPEDWGVETWMNLNTPAEFAAFEMANRNAEAL